MESRISLKDIDISLEGSGTSLDGRITGAESLSVTISSTDTTHYEAGTYLPAEIVDGKVSITGSVTKAWLNNDFIKLLFPVKSTGKGIAAVLKPSFTLRGKVVNAKSPKRELMIYGVKFNSINIQNLTIDNVATQNMPFTAMRYEFLE